MQSSRLNLFSFSGKTRILHLTWFAFFLTFLVWFNHAPLLAAIRETFGLSDQQVKTLLILNVALTIPARIIVGMLVDAIGPKRMFSFMLFLSGILCFGFALADSYEQLALMRFLTATTARGMGLPFSSVTRPLSAAFMASEKSMPGVSSGAMTDTNVALTWRLALS